MQRQQRPDHSVKYDAENKRFWCMLGNTKYAMNLDPPVSPNPCIELVRTNEKVTTLYFPRALIVAFAKQYMAHRIMQAIEGLK